MTAPVERGDTELVAGLRVGDQSCLAGVYDRYADRIFDFLVGMLRDRDDAADAMQDTFLLVSGRIGQLRDPERLRPWLYAIARSVALDRIRARARTRPTEMVTDMADLAPGPERVAEQEALRRLVADTSDGLSDTDRAMLRLHLHGLEGAELGAAMGMAASTAAVRLSRLRDQVGRSLGALLVARLGRRDCPDLDAVLGDWDGRFTPLLRKRVARHVDGCVVCGERRGVAASPWALLSGLVVLPAPPELRDRVLDIALVGHTTTVPSGAVAGGPAHLNGGAVPAALGRFGRSPLARGVAAALVVAALAAGVAFLAAGRPGIGRPVPPAEVVALAPATPSAVPATSTAAAGGGTPSIPELPVVPDPVVPTGSTPVRLPTTTPPDDPGPSTTTPEPTPVVDPPPPPPPPEPIPDPPRITGQDASPPRLGVRGCAVSRADVRVTTDTAATAAVLSWNGGGDAGSMPMQGSGTSWTGSLGPFPEAGAVVWSVTVTNAAGSTTGAAQTIAVSNCSVR